MRGTRRFRAERRPEAEKGSLYLPAEPFPIPRTLVTPDTYMPPSVTPGPVPTPAPKPARPWDDLPPDLKRLIFAFSRLLDKPVITQENPFAEWRVDQVALVNTGSTWLDERTPIAAAQQRFFQGRRAVVIVNHDAANAVFIRHTEQTVAGGGQIAAGGSITLPLAASAKVFGIAVAATSTISFYQFR
jgi:hypothetical protein